MDEVFSYITTSKIDAKLNKDVLEHEDKVEKILILIFFMFVFIFKGWIGYWLRFGVAIPSEYTMAPIDVQADPVQTNYTPEQIEEKTFNYVTLINQYNIIIKPQAHYELSGSVAAKNYGFVFVGGFFDSAALYDLGATWGKLADKRFYNKYLRCYSDKTYVTGARTLYTRYKRYPAPVSDEYIGSHFSHSHIIPANRNVMAAMLKLKNWDKVKIEGELVDIDYKPSNGYVQHYKTSLSRTDSYDTSRGYGSCETIYVTKVQIGRRVYK